MNGRSFLVALALSAALWAGIIVVIVSSLEGLF